MRAWLAVPVVALALTSCAPGPSSAPVTSPGVSTSSGATSAAPSPTPQLPACYARAEALPLRQQVGQLYMAAVSPAGISDAEAATIRETGVGSLLYLGESKVAAERVRELSSSLVGLSDASLPLLIAVDQEGGTVQRMSGPGFTRIPDAVAQAKLPDAQLEASAAEWGAELRSVGIRYNLAPVADVVPEGNTTRNRPIAQLQRGYGSDPAEVGRKVAAFVRGTASAKVATSAKHFPGLGQVVGNTDHEAATDSQTGPDSPLWAPFQAAVDAGVSSIMVSSAVYAKLDADVEAMYSTAIVTGILREKMGFDKVLISDDVGAAKALETVPKAERGTRFLLAGGDLVITADAGALSSMVDHTLAKAEQDSRFAAQVTRSAARVLELKSEVELIDCG